MSDDFGDIQREQHEIGEPEPELERLAAETRLEELRAALRAENISQGELLELESLAEFIEPDDVELLEPAGVPEFADGDDVDLNALTEGQVIAYNRRNGNDPILTCDLCGKREWGGDLTPDWNGETGNHKGCEREAAVRHADVELLEPAGVPETRDAALEDGSDFAIEQWNAVSGHEQITDAKGEMVEMLRQENEGLRKLVASLRQSIAECDMEHPEDEDAAVRWAEDQWDREASR